MKTLLKSIVTCLLSVMLASCWVSGTVTDDYGEAYVNYYPYYFCPDMNFYFNPDLDIYWWYQGGLWRSGPQLPYTYHVGYNTNYVIVSVSNRNPTLYYTQHLQDYRRGNYAQSVYRYGDRPMQSLRSYRPDRTPSGYQNRRSSRNDDIYVPRRSQNYNNQGTRNNVENNGSRSSGTRQNGTYNQSSQPATQPSSGSRPDNSGTRSQDRPQRSNDNTTNQNGQTTRRQSQWNGNTVDNNRQGGSRQPVEYNNQNTTRQPSAVTPQREQRSQPATNEQRQYQNRDNNQPRQQERRVQSSQTQSTPRPAAREEAPKRTEEPQNK